MEKNKLPLILVTNDDGVSAKGLQALIEIVRHMGDIYVVAPHKSNSGKSSAITVDVPIRIKKISTEENLHIYSCEGTPVDCVKFALSNILPRCPDFIVSGINHGSNSSASVIYSGTMGAAIEGCLNGVPSVGFSLCTYDSDADFSHSISFGRIIMNNLLNKGLEQGVCLNVNFPYGNIKGIKVCRQADGMWKEEFKLRTDPYGGDYYWLSGKFINKEKTALDTDEWALSNSYASIVPTLIDLTAHKLLKELNTWDYELKI